MFLAQILTKTNEKAQEQAVSFLDSISQTPPKPKKHPRRWKHTEPDLIKVCFICDSQLPVKYNLPRQQYSQKNLWGYWTGKAADQHKYICNTCLVKLYEGKITAWITEETKTDVFYNYVKRGQFSPKIN